MKSPAFRRTLALALTLALFACDKPIASRDTIFAAIHENVHAFEKKDLETVMATIHPDSPQLEGTRAAVQEMFATVDVKYTLSELRIVSATPEEVKVNFVQRSEKTGGAGQFTDNIVEGIHTLRPDKGRWKIYKTLQTKITDLNGKPLFAPTEPPPSPPIPPAVTLPPGVTPAPAEPAPVPVPVK